MSIPTRPSGGDMPESSGTVGLFRTSLAGPGRTLPDAFSKLEYAPLVERVTRHFNRDLLGARIVLAPSEGKGYWDFTRIRNECYVVIQNYAYTEPRVELMGGDGLIQFNFRLSGDLTLGISRQQPLRLTGPGLFVWQQPQGLEVPEWTAANAHEHSISISIRPEFLVETFFSSGVDAPKALQAFLRGTTNQVNYLHLPLTPEMFGLATKAINNHKHGPVALVFVEALAFELLCEAVTQFDNVAAVVQEHFSARQLRCLNVARDLLTRQFAPPPTIRQIARSAGLAETILTRDFKSAFGETIFDFSLRCRMQHAANCCAANISRSFSGGWEWPNGLLEQRQWIAAAYANGVSMGGNLPARRDGQTPSFAVWAVKDPNGANLDRVQIIKVWEENAQPREKVFDVAWSGNRRLDAAGKVPAIADTVDLGTGKYADNVGATELKAVWRDSEFDAHRYAAYYLRVLEIPTPRWTTLLALQHGLPVAKDVPATVQQRGWSSPIWFTPSTPP